eukprot:CAMPEP_0119264852 /NCGR_PEP_ID=MMETSP1329-20130426/3833_1 /TAXON_ID=114041 /ORGANISM="Genus nov. species nov., Strain RCC1024" /LENGTH=208 /DNA_ID=CAMNT_0007264645 /DNA_START=143 /DNA_END=766 /DNA_ORIENTATION=-
MDTPAKEEETKEETKSAPPSEVSRPSERRSGSLWDLFSPGTKAALEKAKDAKDEEEAQIAAEDAAAAAAADAEAAADEAKDATREASTVSSTATPAAEKAESARESAAASAAGAESARESAAASVTTPAPKSSAAEKTPSRSWSFGSIFSVPPASPGTDSEEEKKMAAEDVAPPPAPEPAEAPAEPEPEPEPTTDELMRNEAGVPPKL